MTTPGGTEKVSRLLENLQISDLLIKIMILGALITGGNNANNKVEVYNPVSHRKQFIMSEFPNNIEK